MKKSTLVILLLLSCVVTGFSQDPGTENYTGPDGKRQGHWTIFGRMQSDKLYAADAKVEEGVYKDSQKTGVWKAYYPSGKNKSEFTYVNNRPNGHAIKYNENGTKYEEGTWVGIRWVGEYHLYYEDGTERQAFNYNTVGQRDGKQVYRNPNGTLAIEVNIKAGKEEGWKKEYDANGHLVRETFFNGGVIDPTKTKEYPPAPDAPKVIKDDVIVGEGEKSQEVKKDERLPTGTFSGEGGPHTLYANGQVTKKGTFHLYRLVDGESRIYDSNGLLIQIKLYRGGKYVGDAPIPADANK
jgi:antitoxin component YwqK of YwqJK toxin-antitoxin module